MKVVALSDMHGYLPKPEEMPDGDLLLIAGDVCPTINHDLPYQQRWLNTEFAEWLESMPYDDIVGVAGNHDFIAEAEPSVMKGLPWDYLQDESIIIEGMVIHGSPWTPVFGGWAFMRPDSELAFPWTVIPEDVDILITHGPPYRLGDKTGPMFGNKHVGSRTLRTRLEELSGLKLHVFGHIHEGRGIYDPVIDNDAILANVTIVDERYNWIYEPEVFELED